jgi:hypothetical protein
MSKVIFEGDGPFHLAVAQQAWAQGHHNNGVTVTFGALLGERQRQHGLEAIEVQMTASVARELGYRLLKAAADADPKVPVFPPSLSAATNARDREGSNPTDASGHERRAAKVASLDG